MVAGILFVLLASHRKPQHSAWHIGFSNCNLDIGVNELQKWEHSPKILGLAWTQEHI